MDPITSAIVAAISAGAIGGLTDVSKAVLTDAYSKLKALLAKKFGKESDIVQAIEQVEAKPASEARKATLAEEVAAVKADQDNDLLQAAQILLGQVHAQPQGPSIIQKVTGNYNAVSYSGNSTVNVNQPKEP